MLVLKYEILFFFQTYRTGDMAWWEKIADFWWGEGWEEWLVFYTCFHFSGFTNNKCVFKEVLVCPPSSNDHGGPLPVLKTNKQVLVSLSSIEQSSQGGLLWRLAWYLRFFLPNYYAEHTHGKDSSEKSNQEVFFDWQVYFPNC